MNVKFGSLPYFDSSGRSARTYSVGDGMSAPLSRPNFAYTCALWFRIEPGCSCIVSPSSTLMPAISVSICAWNSSTSPRLHLARCRCARTALAASLSDRSAVMRRQMPMVRRRRAVLLEERPPLAQRSQIALPGRDILARHLAQLLQILAEARVLRIHHRIRTERRHHPSLPSDPRIFL